MKMVMDCKRGTIYEQHLLSEYYVYKMQNIITEYSYRVGLIQVTHVDTSDKNKAATGMPFLSKIKTNWESG